MVEEDEHGMRVGSTDVGRLASRRDHCGWRAVRPRNWQPPCQRNIY